MSGEGDVHRAAPAARRKRGFPAPATILPAVLVLVWIAAFLIPSGEYQRDAASGPVANSFRYVPSPVDFRRQGPGAAARAGERDVRHPGRRDRHDQSLPLHPFDWRVHDGRVRDRGARPRHHPLAHRFRGRAALLVAILTLLFRVLASIKGWSDESLGLYGVMVPLMIALGYDRLVTVAVVTVAPYVGAAASTINPFQTGIASSKAGVSIADGIGLRLVLLALVLRRPSATRSGTRGG